MDATEVWAVLMAGAFVLLALVGLAVLADRPRGPRPDLARLRAEADELVTHAEAVRAAAARAVQAATEARARVTKAERARDDAWTVQEAAERAYREALRAAREGRATIEKARAAIEQGQAGPSPEVERTDAGPDRERAVSRAALSAYRRGDISVDELREVFRRAGDWDPAQDERERIADRRRVDRAAARRDYDRAAAAARRAERAARVAEVAAEALLDEAAESAAEAEDALLAIRRHPARRRTRRS